MKLNINRKKLRFGGFSVALTAFVIAAVVLLNVLFYALATNLRWYVDMTSEALFTLSDECKTLINDAILGENGVNAKRAEYNREHGLNPGDEDYMEDAKVTIYFCDDPDNLQSSYYMRFIYTTALDLASEFEFIEIGYYNVVYKPSEVIKYQKTGYTVTSNSIIVESGTEYRVFNTASMYMTQDNTPWAYNGEKKLAGAILAVTAAEQPIAYITASHSEAYYDTALLELLQDAGYKIQVEGSEYYDANGDVQTVPTLTDKAQNPLENEDVRLVVVYNPRNDFQTDGVSELDRLNRFLEGNNSMMVFMGPTSPVLNEFESWLADKWGVVFDRYKSSNGDIYSYMINDTSASLDSAGYAIKADYVTGSGLGSSIYSQSLENGIAPSVYFENAMSISYSPNFTLTQTVYDDDPTKDYWFGSYWADGVTKNIFDVFNARPSATAVANGTTVAEGSSANSGATSLYVYKDVDGKIYTLNDAKDKILSPDGEELGYNSNGKLVTAAGTEVEIKNGRIVAVGGSASSDDYGVVIKDIIEFNGSKYSLSADGKSIVDSKGAALPSEEVDGVVHFTTPAGSVLTIDEVAGMASIKVLESAKNTSNPFHLMTITHRPVSEQETNYTSVTYDSYVLACGSLEFATEKYLASAVYGNSDVLLSATTFMGRDVVPVGLEFKPFASFDISDITDAEANRYTLILTILPPVIILGIGIVVLVRRKYS